MAKVSLRAYNGEIEGLIEHGQRLDEAVAHCLHILKTYPKHLETYRLLGKSYLEAKRYDQAVDIFQRVLVAVPDDFVSHVGMSIVSDDQGKLDEAIWHMERAFEVQPSNAAIQGELQRLFGRRDGVEPPKIRLTRGALAHMYVQGELYGQAISEIRAVLGQDPNRTDLQVLLAMAYFRNGQKTEAADACADLLGRYPYCLDANRLMVEILPGTQRADAAPEYRQRVNELDPYAAFTQGSVFDTESVAGGAVSLERLEYAGQTAGASAAFGLGLGSGVETGRREAPQQGWEANPKSPIQTTNDVPAFVRQAGWEPPDSASEYPRAPAAPESEFVPAALPSDLPAWVRALAPSEDTATGGDSLGAAEDAPEWLRNTGGDLSAAPLLPSGEIPDSGSTEWQTGSGTGPQDVPAATRSASTVASGSAAVGSDRTATWPQDLGANLPSTVSEWSSPTKGEDLDRDGQTPPNILGSLGTTPAEQDDAMAWLESLAAKQGAPPEELVTKADARPDSAPRWVEKAREMGERGPDAWASLRSASLEQTAADVDAADSWLPPEDGAKSATPSQGQDLDWLSGLAGHEPFEHSAGEVHPTPPAKPRPVPDALPVTEQPRNEPQPSWLGADLSAAGAPASATSFDQQKSPADLPAWLADLDKEQTGGPGDAAIEELPVWLRPEVEPEAPVQQRSAPTDWHPSGPKVAADAPAPEAHTASVILDRAPVRAAARSAARSEPAAMQSAALADARIKVPTLTQRAVGASLGSAQAELGRGNIAAALALYGKLIRKGKSLEEIIRDLRDALYRYPVEVPIWQALGDAYMRGNRLQEALDAYTKAEELLR